MWYLRNYLKKWLELDGGKSPLIPLYERGIRRRLFAQAKSLRHQAEGEGDYPLRLGGFSAGVRGAGRRAVPRRGWVEAVRPSRRAGR